MDWYIWAGFIAFILLMLGIDLGIVQRKAHVVPFREAVMWTGVWVTLALTFGVITWVWRGSAVAQQYIAGYLIEWSLSVDNVFVWILIFSHFAVPREYQHRVLFWGVLGAIVLRLIFILGGTALLNRFEWVIYVFGALLLVTAYRFLVRKEQETSVEESAVLRLVRRFVPLTEGYEGQQLIVKRGGRRVATPLFAVLVMVEATDVVFAVDSIPAIFAITRDAFVVFSSNALAILGLRSLYFVLAGAVTRFRYLRPSLGVLLLFVGGKMLLSDVVHISTQVSLAVIVAILGTGVVASWLRPGHEELERRRRKRAGELA
ncbi:MAG: TerC family protein [Actinomycetota bacterium]|nr:TerC family protein [Actinomycetota bacterium]